MTISPYDRIYDAIQKNECFLEKDALIVFVCGKDIKKEDSKRKIFLDYAEKHFQGFHFLLAEDLFSSINQSQKQPKQDLLTIEKRLSDYSDCILLILESESTFAELGAFAVNDDLCQKIIPVNDQIFSKDPSFINLGPLTKIDSCKNGLGQTISANMESITHCFGEIQKRLGNIQKMRRKRLKFKTIEELNNKAKERLLLVFDLVKLLSPVPRGELIDLFKKLYVGARLDEIHFDLDLLKSLNFIGVISQKSNGNKDEYLYPKKDTLHFVDFGTNYIQLKSDVILYYKKNFPERLKLLGQIVAERVES